MITIDAKNLIAGRLATYVAKQALLGQSIEIVNAEQAVITGKRDSILQKYKERMARGMPKTGPFFYRKEHQFLKRLIRGMLPWSQEKGRVAFKRVKCYIGIPDKLKNTSFQTLENANIKKVQHIKYLTIKEIVMLMGDKEQ